MCPGRFCAELISSSFKEYPNRRCIPRQNDLFIFLALYIYRSECKLHICPSSLPMTLNCNLTISCRQRRQQHAEVKRIRFYDLLCNNPPKLNKEKHCGCRKQSELLKLAVCVYCRLYFALFCFCAFRRLQFSSGHPTIDLCTD